MLEQDRINAPIGRGDPEDFISGHQSASREENSERPKKNGSMAQCNPWVA
jgi:hypothetical protein